jgi:hypothetical protein
VQGTSKQQQCNQTEHTRKLDGLQTHDSALKPQGGMQPLAEEPFLFPAHGAFSAVSTDRHETQHGVQIEPRQAARMAPNAQVSLGQGELCDQHREQCARGDQCYKSSGGRL